MNYQKIYEQLTAKDMIADYTEKHHIIPRCMGGSNNPSNLVLLTPEAHYVAHQLLVKIYPHNHKLVYAANMMGNCRITNKLYGWLRRKFSIAASIANKGKTISDEHKAKISASLTGRPSPNKGKSMPDSMRTKLSSTNTGRVVSSKTRAKLSVTNTGKRHSEETKSKMRSAHNGKQLSDNHKSNISSAKTGILKSANHKANISAAMKGKQKIELTCPYCNKIGRGGNMKRYHFDNCKRKP
jgi:hypothetical protein